MNIEVKNIKHHYSGVLVILLYQMAKNLQDNPTDVQEKDHPTVPYDGIGFEDSFVVEKKTDKSESISSKDIK